MKYLECAGLKSLRLVLEEGYLAVRFGRALTITDCGFDKYMPSVAPIVKEYDKVEAA